MKSPRSPSPVSEPTKTHDEQSTAPTPEPEVFLDLGAAAELLNIKRSTLSAWVSTGRVDIPHVRLAPRTVRFPRREVLRWLEAKRAESKAAMLDSLAAQGAAEDGAL